MILSFLHHKSTKKNSFKGIIINLAKTIFVKRKYILPLLLVLQIITLQILSFFPKFVEQYYSNGIYPLIAKFSRIAMGTIPFSVGDCVYFIVIFFVIRWFWLRRKTWRVYWKDNVLRILSFFSVFYFLFYSLWAINYYRLPLFKKMNIQLEYTDAELLVFTKKLIAKTNAVQNEIEKDNNKKIVFPYTQQQVFDMNLNGYKKLSARYPNFTYAIPSVKKSIISLPLTFMGFGGYLNPFTNEAQVNDLMPMYSFPATAYHEMAHQMGYASESECNFIGFLASIENENLYYQYSGYSSALRYCLSNWKIRDKKVLKELKKTINPGILKNYKESENFWRQYDTPIETGFRFFYDNYLKLNHQDDGMDSYNKFVDLMVNYYKTREL